MQADNVIIYSLDLSQAVIDDNHLILPSELANLIPAKTELDLNGSGSLSVSRQEEILTARGLVKKLSPMGLFLQWTFYGESIRVSGLSCGPSSAKPEIAIKLDPPVIFAENPLPLLKTLGQGPHAPAESYFLAREISELSLKPGFDQLLSFNMAQCLATYPHQVNTVKTVLRRMRGRALLCDEVGLGKTVEAGLITMEYILRGMVKRVLILTPPSLVLQWQEEMDQKFNQDFVTADSAQFAAAGDAAWSRFPFIIASIDQAKRAETQSKVINTRFDLVIVDEAHRLRNRNTAAWKLVNALDKKYILLLTATPVQNDLDELFNLVTLLKPGQLKTTTEFHKQFVEKKDRLKPQHADQLRLLVSEVMVRNRRSSSGIHLTRRHSQVISTEMLPLESELYQRITALVRRYYTREKSPISRFTLSELQMEMGSSPAAVFSTLERRLEQPLPDDLKFELQELRKIAAWLDSSAKLSALQKTLATLGSEKVVVFTHYLSTLKWIQSHLPGITSAIYHGGLTAREKDGAIERFRGDSRLLLTTDSGGEGRNLQFCHILFNFDLPWNPMRIEQRIGRLSRIGQPHDVYIFNLSNRGTVEDHLLEILDRKINMFELVVGELDLILGRLGEEKDLEETILEMVGTSYNDVELKEKFDQLGMQMETSRTQYENLKSAEDALFGEVINER
jgi:SNF2 family DNA or RNA helicase